MSTGYRFTAQHKQRSLTDEQASLILFWRYIDGVRVVDIPKYFKERFKVTVTLDVIRGIIYNKTYSDVNAAFRNRYRIRV